MLLTARGTLKCLFSFTDETASVADVIEARNCYNQWKCRSHSQTTYKIAVHERSSREHDVYFVLQLEAL
jgi:hypothetical protein